MMQRVLLLSALAVLIATPVHAARPARAHAEMPDAYGLHYEPVEFFSADSVRLSGWWIPGLPKANAVVLASGEVGTMAGRLKAAKAFHDRGYHVMTFDYRDFGPHGPGPQDSLRYVFFASRWVSDMAGALRYARTRVDTTVRLFAVGGPDLAGTVTLAAAARGPELCDGLVVQGLYHTTDAAMQLYGIEDNHDATEQMRRKVVLRDEPDAAARRLKVPVLMVIGVNDSLTSPSATYEVIVRSHARKDRLQIPDAGHLGLEDTPGYFDKVCAWFSRMALMPRGN